MSSHHIVRENQEPALVIFDAHAISFEKVQELLEWIPTVIVLYTEAETVLSWGIKIDVLLVPAGEAEKWIALTKDQQPIEVISLGIESAIKQAFDFVESRHIAAVNCLIPDARVLGILTQVNQDIEVFFNNTRWSRIKSGRFEKWITAGSRLSILPIELQAEIEGVADGVYVTNQDGMVTLKASASFWVGEELV